MEDVSNLEEKYHDLIRNHRTDGDKVLSIQCEVLEDFKEFVKHNNKKKDINHINTYLSDLNKKFEQFVYTGHLDNILSKFASTDFLKVLRKISNGNETLDAIIEYIQILPVYTNKNSSETQELDNFNKKFKTEVLPIYYPTLKVKTKKKDLI